MSDLALDLSTVHTHAYEKLRSLITEGQIASGERLDERALAAALGVSRTPIREAVTRLASDGLVEHRPYQGNFVKSFSANQVAGLYDVRRALEMLAAREAVPRLDEDGLAAVRDALDAASAALEKGDMLGFAEADRSFHRLIVENSGNETLIRLLRNLEGQIQLIRVVANRSPELVERTLREREAIFGALDARDSERAAELIGGHIDDVKNAVVEQLASRDADASQP